MISHFVQKDAIAKTNLQPCMKLMTSPFWTDVQTDAGEKVKGVCAKPDGRGYYPGPAKKAFSPSILHAQTLQRILGGRVVWADGGTYLGYLV